MYITFLYMTLYMLKSHFLCLSMKTSFFLRVAGTPLCECAIVPAFSIDKIRAASNVSLV